MNQLALSLISTLVLLPHLGWPQENPLDPRGNPRENHQEKLGELDFGKVRPGELRMRTASLVNRTDEPWIVPLIEVTGKGFQLMGRNFAYIGAHSTGDFLIKFAADPKLEPGFYQGKCLIHTSILNDTQRIFEYDLKVQVVEGI